MISGWDGRKTRFRFRGFGGGRGGGEERVDGERWVGILFENDSASEFSKEDLGNWLKTMMDS